MNNELMLYRFEDFEPQEWFLLAKILTLCCEKAEGSLRLDINDKDFSDLISKIDAGSVNYTQVELMLKYLGDNRVIDWEAFGDDGFSPDFIFEFNQDTFRFFREKILVALYDDRKAMLEKISELEEKINSLYGFNPQKIDESIKKSNTNAEELLKQIEKDNHLSSLLSPVKEFQKYLRGLSAINEVYQDIYSVITRPIQEEGKKGVRETVKWAIISVIASTLISFLLSNSTMISNLFNDKSSSVNNSTSISTNTNPHNLQVVDTISVKKQK